MDWIDEEPPAPPPPAPIPIPGCTPTAQLARNKRTVAWDALLPQLEAPLAAYRQATHGQRPAVVSNVIQHEYPEQIQVATCSCVLVAVLLVRNGVFPTSPSQPRTGVSIDFLEIYRALFERSCDRNPCCRSPYHLRPARIQRHFNEVLRIKGKLAKDPFREGLAQAVQWYSNLRTRVQSNLNSALAAAEAVTLLILTSPAQTTASEAVTGLQHRWVVPPPMRTTLRVLQALKIPSPHLDVHTGFCENGAPPALPWKTWGRPLAEYGIIIHISICVRWADSYDPSYFISKEKVDKVRERMSNARCGKPATVTPPIPQEAIDACEASWDAANEKKQKVDPKRHDASGVFVMTCRHLQVLFLCNIDTPGEQQQYIVALMEEVNTLLPPQATIVQAYDVGCVTDHSLKPVGLPIVYSPRLRHGLCLTDAEGVERFWSRIRKLIGITRKLMGEDQYAAFVNEKGRDNLGSWIHRQEHKNLVKKRMAATKVL
ncbi:hypothetical protein DFH09DRAFT_1118999, partial [Mycena vulgaris]